MTTFRVLQEVQNVGHLERDRLGHGNNYLCMQIFKITKRVCE